MNPQPVLTDTYLRGMPAIIKNKIMPFAAIWIDIEIIILSEVSQRKTNIM